MRKGLILISILSSIFFINACTNEKIVEPGIEYQYPVAAFSYTGNEGPAPVSVQFINQSETIIADSCEYTWTFGENGPESSLKNPIHTFTNSGNEVRIYMVTLKVHDLISNLSQTRSLAIEIKASTK